jgi:hypothetical protein
MERARPKRALTLTKKGFSHEVQSASIDGVPRDDRPTQQRAGCARRSGPAVRAEESSDPAALATALKDTSVTLQDGLKASEREGQPISAKFEIEKGKLQLSVYTMKGNDFFEVVADSKTGAIAKKDHRRR